MNIIELLSMATTIAAVWVVWSAPRKPRTQPKVWNWPDYYSRGLIEKQWEPVEHFHGEWVVQTFETKRIGQERENGGRA